MLAKRPLIERKPTIEQKLAMYPKPAVCPECGNVSRIFGRKIKGDLTSPLVCADCEKR